MDEKKVLDIEVRGKTFTIEFVNNWVIKAYESHNRKLIKLQELYKKLELFPPKEEMQALANEIQKIGNNLLDDKLEIVEELLTTNDIDFNRSWWERKTNTEDISVFLNKCAFKDTIINSKKKAMPA